jgi:hypothetical protein
MADQNVTTTKYQRLEELRQEEMIGDSTHISTIAEYIKGLAEVLSSVDHNSISPQSIEQVAYLQYQFATRLIALVDIQKQEAAA